MAAKAELPTGAPISMFPEMTPGDTRGTFPTPITKFRVTRPPHRSRGMLRGGGDRTNTTPHSAKTRRILAAGCRAPQLRPRLAPRSRSVSGPAAGGRLWQQSCEAAGLERSTFRL